MKKLLILGGFCLLAFTGFSQNAPSKTEVKEQPSKVEISTEVETPITAAKVVVEKKACAKDCKKACCTAEATDAKKACKKRCKKACCKDKKSKKCDKATAKGEKKACCAKKKSEGSTEATPPVAPATPNK